MILSLTYMHFITSEKHRPIVQNMSTVFDWLGT